MGDDETLRVGDDTKRLLLRGVKRHIEVDFPLLKERVAILERKECKIEELQERIIMVETQTNITSGKVDSLGEKFELFTNEMRKEFQLFTNTIRSINNNFIYWLVGTVLLSLILGLFTQFKAFHDVHECIHKLDKKVSRFHDAADTTSTRTRKKVP
jgi:hypothetical protein